jgi:hypothetical protein
VPRIKLIAQASGTASSFTRPLVRRPSPGAGHRPVILAAGNVRTQEVDAGGKMETPSLIEGPARAWRLRAVALSMAAGLVHILVSPVYFAQWIGYGVFFVTVGALQGIGAFALVGARPHRIFYWAGLVGNSMVVLIWLITRTVGIPLLGPAAGELQPVGLPDGLATMIELVLIGHLAVLLSKFGQLTKEPLVK